MGAPADAPRRAWKDGVSSLQGFCTFVPRSSREVPKSSNAAAIEFQRRLESPRQLGAILASLAPKVTFFVLILGALKRLGAAADLEVPLASGCNTNSCSSDSTVCLKVKVKFHFSPDFTLSKTVSIKYVSVILKLNCNHLSCLKHLK